MTNKSEQKKKIRLQMETSFGTLMEGSCEECRQAKKDLKALWNSDSKHFQKNAYVALSYMREFDAIETDRNKAAFVSCLNLFFFVLADDYFDELKEFTLKAVQHPNGQVRRAMVNTADWLYVSLTARIDLLAYKANDELLGKAETEQKKAAEQYIEFVRDIERLIEQYDDKNERAEYVDDMKPSVNKSLQYLWSGLTDTPAYREVLEKTQPISLDLFMKRQEIEASFKELLDHSNTDLSMDDIKEVIYNEQDSDDIRKILGMIDNGERSTSELNAVLQTITEAWNHFPHRQLNGLSPYEILQQYDQPNA